MIGEIELDHGDNEVVLRCIMDSLPPFHSSRARLACDALNFRAASKSSWSGVSHFDTIYDGLEAGLSSITEVHSKQVI